MGFKIFEHLLAGYIASAMPEGLSAARGQRKSLKIRRKFLSPSDLQRVRASPGVMAFGKQCARMCWVTRDSGCQVGAPSPV